LLGSSNGGSTMLSVLPIALFIFFQRYFVEGLVMSGIKG
jgi:ABC-type glycerol-3-phosphate transport system permease component